MKKILLFLAMLFTTATVHAQDNVSARRPFGQHTVAFTATPTFDAGTTENWKMTLTGNVTSSTLTGAEAGMFLKWEICQDNVGSHTFVWPSQLQNPITITATANACTTEIFYYDGTNGLIPVTTTSGGGGSGTVNAGTVGQIAQYSASTTVSSDAKLDDGNTNANGLTYSGTAGIFAQTYSATGTGAMTLSGKEGTCSGAAATFDVICVGDSISHSIETSLNGGSFFPVPQHQSTSPTPHGPLVAETFPQIFAVGVGTAGQPFLSGGAGADPGYAALNIASSTNVTGILQKTNALGTVVYTDQANTGGAAMTLDMSGSITTASAFRVPNKAGCTVALNGADCYDTTSNNRHFGTNSADSIVPVTTITPTNGNCAQWTIVSGNVQLGQAAGACGTPGGSPPLNNIVAATGANTIFNGDNAQIWQASLTTASKHWFTIDENSASTATGTPYLWDVHSIASSTANPVIFTTQGTVNGWNLLNSGSLWAPVGAGALAIPGTAHGVVISQGAGSATTLAPEVAAGKVLIDNGPGQDPSFQDPVISQAFVNIWNAQDITATRTSANVRNPIFSQSATLQLTFAGITGSPSGCTLQFRGVDSQGNVLNNSGTVSISPANGTSSQTFTAASTLQTAAQVSAVYACSVYPTAGTLTLDFTPIPNVNVTNIIAVGTIPAGTNIIGKVGIDQTTPGTTNAVSATNLPTTVDTNSGTKSASTLRVVLATDQPALTNKLLVTPDSVALPAHQSTNVDQLNGTTTDTNSGNKSAGTLRVVIATDQPQLTNSLKVDGSGVTQPVSGTVTANIGTTNGLALDTTVAKLNNAQGSTTSGQTGPLMQGAVTTSAPSYTTAQTSPLSLTTAGALRTDASATTQPISGTVTANIQSNASVNQAQIGGSAVVADPCQQLARSSANINLTAGGQVITGAASKQTYICSMELITATAQNIALVEGTGTVCATGIAGMAGGTTAATGWNFGANGGFVKGIGANWVFKTATAADNVCLLLSGTGQTSGSIQYVQQ